MANTGLIMSDRLMYGFVGGPTFSNDVVVTSGGRRQVIAHWDEGLKKWQARQIPQSKSLTEAMVAFFRIHKGGAKTFLLKDPLDYSFVDSEGLLGAGLGTGTPTYQIYRRRVSGSLERPAKTDPSEDRNACGKAQYRSGNVRLGGGQYSGGLHDRNSYLCCRCLTGSNVHHHRREYGNPGNDY